MQQNSTAVIWKHVYNALLRISNVLGDIITKCIHMSSLIATKYPFCNLPTDTEVYILEMFVSDLLHRLSNPV